jgi:hypothetical protein
MVRTRDKKLHALPTDLTVVYPESDGKPMAETDFHYEIMTDTIDTLKERYAEHHDVYVAGNLIVSIRKNSPKSSLPRMCLWSLGSRKRSVEPIGSGKKARGLILS